MVMTASMRCRVDGVEAGGTPSGRRRARIEFEAIRTATASVPRRYSLQWFQALFVAAISKAEKAETLEARLDVLNTFFTYYVYVNVCRC